MAASNHVKLQCRSILFTPIIVHSFLISPLFAFSYTFCCWCCCCCCYLALRTNWTVYIWHLIRASADSNSSTKWCRWQQRWRPIVRPHTQFKTCFKLVLLNSCTHSSPTYSFGSVTNSTHELSISIASDSPSFRIVLLCHFHFCFFFSFVP